MSDDYTACCEIGADHATNFLILRSARASNEQMIAALADWCVHLIDVHDAGGMADPRCGPCWGFGKGAPEGFSRERWLEEGRIHRVYHTLDLDRLAHTAMSRQDAP